jgi:hypothetical protein
MEMWQDYHSDQNKSNDIRKELGVYIMNKNVKDYRTGWTIWTQWKKVYSKEYF